MKHLLLGFIGNQPASAFRAKSDRAVRIQHKKSLQGVDAGSGFFPVFVAVPLKFVFHGFGQTTAVNIAVTAQNAPGYPFAEGVDEFFSQKSLGHRVENQGSLTGKMYHPAMGI